MSATQTRRRPRRRRGPRDPSRREYLRQLHLPDPSLPPFGTPVADKDGIGEVVRHLDGFCLVRYADGSEWFVRPELIA